MLSLENSYNAEDLFEWDRKCKELSNQTQISYCVEPKFDGASISLIYENNQLIRAATRGNGIQGDDITLNAKQIRSIPLQAPLDQFGIKQIELRGEVLITKERFKQYNQRLIEQNLPPLANARNAASGSLRIKDPNEVAKRKLDAYLYHISYVSSTPNQQITHEFSFHHSALQALSSCGFKTSAAYIKTFDTIQDVIDYVQTFEKIRDELPYEIDGMVIKVNDTMLQDKIGQTSHHPRWAIAYKFKARQATSKLLQIDFQVGRTGSITPVAKIQPVSVGGVTISSISLFNEEIIQEKDLRIGDTILVERAGDVIPYIVKSFPEWRDGTELAIVFPTSCPVCQSSLIKPEGETVTRCVNYHCEAQVVERIIHFVSKDAMDIRGLGDALIRRFYEMGVIKNIADIYILPFEQLKSWEGLGEKSIQKLQEAIEKSKSQPIARLLFALGIRYVGETTAKALARSISHIHDLYSKTSEELCMIEDVGEKVSKSIVDYFADTQNKELLSRLASYGVQMQHQQSTESNDMTLTGKTFLFTGTLSMKRNDAEQLVELKGGQILNSVSSKLNYLVVGEDAGSKLEKAKKLGTVKILTEEEFKMLVS
jgi:DNA ligase, NAD-dependent